MKTFIVAMALIALNSTHAYAATSKYYQSNTSKIKSKKSAKAIPQKPMRLGQKTIICSQPGKDIHGALHNINQDLSKSRVKSHTAKNLTIAQPFKAVEAPVVHSEKRKRSADVYVACVKIKKA